MRDRMASAAQGLQIASDIVVSVLVTMVHAQLCNRAAALASALLLTTVCLDAATPHGIILPHLKAALPFFGMKCTETCTRASTCTALSRRWHAENCGAVPALQWDAVSVLSGDERAGHACSRTEAPCAAGSFSARESPSAEVASSFYERNHQPMLAAKA